MGRSPYRAGGKTAYRAQGKTAYRRGEELLTSSLVKHVTVYNLAAHGYRALADAVEGGRPYEVSCPAALVCGTKDMAGSSKRYSRTWAARTGLPLFWLEGAGHNSNTDAPDEANAVIEDFAQLSMFSRSFPPNSPICARQHAVIDAAYDGISPLQDRFDVTATSSRPLGTLPEERSFSAVIFRRNRGCSILLASSRSTQRYN